MRIILIFILMFQAHVVLPQSDLVDIRPREIIDGVLPEEVKKGRELIQASFNAHGWKNVPKGTIIRADYTDDWSVGEEFFLQFNNWPNVKQKIQQDFISFEIGNTTAQLLAGERKGEIWGLDKNDPYIQLGNEVSSVDDANMYPALTSKHYLLQLPYWISQVPIISYVKDTIFNNVEYSLVFGTWKTLEPNATYDQYVYWINKRTKLMEIVNFTVRAVGPTAFGYAIFEDFRTVNGAIVSFKHRMGYMPTKEGDIHVLTFDKVEFDPSGVDNASFRKLK